MKPVLIIENSKNGLKMNESASNAKKKQYLLEGVFTEFDIENRNNRVYTANEFVPHVDAMMEKKKWGVVYGEFDHPDVFDVSMKYVSHTVESAVYNQEKNRVDGEIRLLNTIWGKEAKSLVEDGCPIFVSSRAAGITESTGNVKVKQLFTYDIVADPGFSSARMNMKSLNESFGYSNDDNFRIYDVPQNESHIFDLSDDAKTNELFEMNKNEFVTKKQLSEYSKYLTSEIKKIKGAMVNKVNETKDTANAESELNKFAEYYDQLQEQQENVIKYLDYLAEKVSVSISKSNNVEKKTDKVVEYTNYLAENLDKNIDYSNYLAENLDKNIDYSNYLAENLDKNISYSEYLAENLDSSIDYSNYLAESLDGNIAYAEYIAENLDANIGYTEYLSENLEANIGYAEYLSENLESSINYTEYIAECADKTMQYADMISEKLNTEGKEGGLIKESITSAENFLITESKKEEEKEVESKDKVEEEEENCDTPSKKSTKKVEAKKAKKAKKEEVEEEEEELVEESITNKIDKLIAEAKKREASKEKEPAFYAFLSTDDIKAFESLNDDERESVIVAVNESVGYYSRQDVLNIMHQAIEKEGETLEEKVVSKMPEDVKPIWESLDAKSQKSVLAQAKFYTFSNEDSYGHFWTTRKFKTPLNESKRTLVDFSNPLHDSNKLSDSEMDEILNKFKGF